MGLGSHKTAVRRKRRAVALVCHLALRRDRTTPSDPDLYSIGLRIDRRGDGIDPDVLCY